MGFNFVIRFRDHKPPIAQELGMTHFNWVLFTRHIQIGIVFRLLVSLLPLHRKSRLGVTKPGWLNLYVLLATSHAPGQPCVQPHGTSK